MTGLLATILLVQPLAGVPVAELPNDPTKVRPIAKGAALPDAPLRTAEDKPATLRNAVEGKPSVIVFYRGGWCPYCNRHLAELAQAESKIRAKGYRVIGVAPDLPKFIAETQAKGELPYTLYSDADAKAATALGIAFRLDDATFTKYKDSYKLDLETRSGATHHALPVPAVFVVNGKGKVTYVHTNPDYRKRLSVAELLAAL
jgi:peroxiredoxin